MKKIRSLWVPHQLTHEKRVELCRENLAKLQNGFCRLCDSITGDETWIYHRQIHHHKSKDTSWVGEGESPTTVVRRSKFEPKALFSTFFR